MGLRTSAFVALTIYVAACSAARPLEIAVQSVPALTTPSALHEARSSSSPTSATLTEFLTEISDWIMTTGVGSNVLNNASYFGTLDSIFINGDLARVLLAASKITGNSTYRAEGLRWCDAFVAKQLPINTSTGKAAGYWDTGYHEVFIADTGTAVAALAVGWHIADAPRKDKYLDAMQKYHLFVTEGCTKAPTNPPVDPSGACPPAGTGWVHTSGKNKGALGDGWYKKTINLTPYTISTATTGSCAFVELDVIAHNSSLQTIATDAVQWIIDSMSDDGRIPYIITPTDISPTTYQPITYSTESFIDVDLRYNSPQTKALLAPLKKTVLWLVSNQSADGSWGYIPKPPEHGLLGFSASGDAQRSPRALSLLQWYYQRMEPLPEVQAAIQKYVNYLLNKDHWDVYGINRLALPTGFIGLAVADLIEPWCTFSPLTFRHEYVLGQHPLW